MESTPPLTGSPIVIEIADTTGTASTVKAKVPVVVPEDSTWIV